MKITDLKNYTVVADKAVQQATQNTKQKVPLANKIADFFGAKGITEQYGATIAKAKLPKEQRQFVEEPGLKKVGGSALQFGANFIPGAGAGANLTTRVAVGAGTGLAMDVGSKLQNNENPTPGIGTAIGGGLPIAGQLIKPGVKFIGNLLKGTGSALSGAPSEAIEKIYQNPKVALQTAKEIRKSGSASVLRKNAEQIVQGIGKIKQEARGAYGKGLEQLSKVDIEPTTFKNNVQKVLDDVGSVLDKGTRKLGNVEFTDPKNIKKANELINRLSNTDLDGKSLRKLIDDIENTAYKTATSDERLSYNAFTKKLASGLKNAINSSTSKLDDINKQFSGDMQLAETAEDIFGNVKYKNLGEVLKASQKLEGMFSQKGLAPEVVDQFLERVGVSSSAFKAGEAMRQVGTKTFSPNSVGTSPFEIVRAFTSSVVSPKMIGQIAAYTGIAENVIKEMSEKLSPSIRKVLIQSLVNNKQQ